MPSPKSICWPGLLPNRRKLMPGVAKRPGRPFYKSVNRRTLCSLETSNEEFWGCRIVKWSVQLEVFVRKCTIWFHSFFFNFFVSILLRGIRWPDEPFQNFGALESVDRRTLSSSETLGDGFKSSEIVKGLVGEYFILILFLHIYWHKYLSYLAKTKSNAGTIATATTRWQCYAPKTKEDVMEKGSFSANRYSY